MSLTSRCSSYTSCAGQFLSRGFVVLLRKNIPQKHNLKTAAELGIIGHRLKPQCFPHLPAQASLCRQLAQELLRKLLPEHSKIQAHFGLERQWAFRVR